MVKEFNILITGVGGQGVILMSELLGKAAVGVKLDIVILRNWTTRLQKSIVPTESPN